MSYSELFTYRADGLMRGHTEFHNGWGSAPRVWSSLCDKYRAQIFPNGKGPTISVFDEWEKLDQVKDHLGLSWFEWNVMEWTQDRMVYRREHFELFAKSLRAFDEAFPVPGKVSHLIRLAEIVEELIKDESVLGLGYYHTSVAENLWLVRVDEDDYRPYDVNKDTGHYFVEARSPV